MAQINLSPLGLWSFLVWNIFQSKLLPLNDEIDKAKQAIKQRQEDVDLQNNVQLPQSSTDYIIKQRNCSPHNTYTNYPIPNVIDFSITCFNASPLQSWILHGRYNQALFSHRNSSVPLMKFVLLGCRFFKELVSQIIQPLIDKLLGCLDQGYLQFLMTSTQISPT